MKLDFEKGGGLIPVVIQDNTTLSVLMLGFMNQEAYERSSQEGLVTFFSRTKNRLWTKGETSGNFLKIVSISQDCDEDTLLIKVNASGPVCHTGKQNCFSTTSKKDFIFNLEQIIDQRYTNPLQESYINKLRNKGLNKIAQKVGEEGVETVIAALNETREDLINESSDLLFHLLVLLREKGISLDEIGENLEKRHNSKEK